MAIRPAEDEELGSMASVDSCSMEADIPSGTLSGGERIQKLNVRYAAAKVYGPKLKNSEIARPKTANSKMTPRQMEFKNMRYVLRISRLKYRSLKKVAVFVPFFIIIIF